MQILHNNKKIGDGPVVMAVVVRGQEASAVVVVPVLPCCQEKQHPDQVHEHATKGQDYVQPPRFNLGRVYQPWDGVQDDLHA